MAKIELLQVGCTFREIMDAINALIAVHNDGEEIGVVSYNSLADLPQINGVELKGNKNTAALLVALAGCTDYNTIMATLATKAYSDAGDNALINASAAAAQAVLDSKLDKDLGNIDAATSVGDDAFIAVVSGGKVVKITTAALAAYTEIKNKVESSSYEAAAKTQRKTIALEEEPDGRTITFTATTAFQMGSSALYLNGNRQYLDEHYKEESSTQITFKSYVPDEEDNILFEAIPLDVKS